MSQTLPIVIDTREHKPLRFPVLVTYRHRGTERAYVIRTERRKLITGDYAAPALYAVDGAEHDAILCGPLYGVVEKKGRITEVCTNTLTADRARFRTALDRLAGATCWPCLLFEGSSASAFAADPHAKDRPNVWGLDALLYELACRRISLLWLPASRNLYRTGTVVAKWLIAAAIVAGKL